MSAPETFHKQQSRSFAEELELVDRKKILLSHFVSFDLSQEDYDVLKIEKECIE